MNYPVSLDLGLIKNKDLQNLFNIKYFYNRLYYYEALGELENKDITIS